MLRGLLKREIEIEPLNKPAAQPSPHLVPVRAPNPSPNPCPKTRRKPHAKSFPILLLYPECEPEPQLQAEALLHEIQKYVDAAAGKYVPSTHLQRFYGELCEREGWQRKHWCVMGHALGKLTERVCKKRAGKRFMAYKIPRVCA